MLILCLCHNAWDHRDGHLQLPPNLAECQILRQHRRPWLITGNADAQRTARWHSQRHQNSQQHSCQARDSPVHMKCPVHRQLGGRLLRPEPGATAARRLCTNERSIALCRSLCARQCMTRLSSCASSTSANVRCAICTSRCTLTSKCTIQYTVPQTIEKAVTSQMQPAAVLKVARVM